MANSPAAQVLAPAHKNTLLPVDDLIAASALSASRALASQWALGIMPEQAKPSGPATSSGLPSNTLSDEIDLPSKKDVILSLMSQGAMSTFALADVPDGISVSFRDMPRSSYDLSPRVPPDAYVIAPMADLMTLSAFGEIPELALASKRDVKSIVGMISPDMLKENGIKEQFDYAVSRSKIIYDGRDGTLIERVRNTVDSTADKCSLDIIYHGAVSVPKAAHILRCQTRTLVEEIVVSALIPKQFSESDSMADWNRRANLFRHFVSVLKYDDRETVAKMIFLAEAITCRKTGEPLGILYKNLGKKKAITEWKLERMRKALLYPVDDKPSSARIRRATDIMALLSHAGDIWQYALDSSPYETAIEAAGMTDMKDRIFSNMSDISLLIEVIGKAGETLGVPAMMELVRSGVPVEDIVQ